jgi:hypothetical protein
MGFKLPRQLGKSRPDTSTRGYALDSSQPEEIDKAPFWLADSGDPRALALFEEILAGR